MNADITANTKKEKILNNNSNTHCSGRQQRATKFMMYIKAYKINYIKKICFLHYNIFVHLTPVDCSGRRLHTLRQ